MNPVFVVGVGRSGTTLLVNLLGCHPLLSPIFETSFLRNLVLLCDRASWYWGDSLSRKIASAVPGYSRSVFVAKCHKYTQKCEAYKQIISSLPSPEERRVQNVKHDYEVFPFENQAILFDMDELMEEANRFIGALQAGSKTEPEIYGLARDGVNRLFTIHCTRAHKPHWINKTPRLLLCLDLLPKLYPNAKCIHIIRDGRDVSASFRSLSWGPKDVRKAARRWKARMAARKRVNPDALGYLELRYEDLIRAPEAALEKVLDFLQLNGDPSEMLSSFKVYSQRVGVWQTIFTTEEKHMFDDEAGDLLIELGYERDHDWAR